MSLKSLFAFNGYHEEANDGTNVGDAGDPPNYQSAGDPPAGNVTPPAKPENKAPGLTDNEAKLLREVMERKNAQKELAAKAAELEEKLKTFEGIDIEAYRKMADEQKAAEERKLTEKGEWEALKTQLVEQHKQKEEKLKERIKALEEANTNHSQLVTKLTIGHAFDSSDYLRKSTYLTPSKARVIYGEHFDIKDGSLVAYDKPRGAANRVELVDASGNNVSFEEAIQRIIDADPEKKDILRPQITPGTGSGAKPGSSSSAPPNNDVIPKLSPTEKIRMGLSNIK